MPFVNRLFIIHKVCLISIYKEFFLNLKRNLWTTFLRDSSNSLSNLNDRLLKKNEKENEYLILSVSSLTTKLVEYEKLFERYLTTTKSFSMRNENLKRSSQKNYEDLKFIPINLHNEQFEVESIDYTGNLKNSCYEFVSVGAFTAEHVSKSIYPKNIENIMKTEQKFGITNPINDNTEKHIHNEPILLFYSLKILILVLDELEAIASSDDKIQVI